MTTSKKRGTMFEYRVSYLLEGLGFSWDRSGSSLGIDLKISKKGKLRYLISCKKTTRAGPIYLPKGEVERLKASAKETGAEGLVCFGFMRTPVLALNLKEISKLPSTRLYYKIQMGDGRPLKELLQTANF
ncbi:MAG: restriction endonuclease [Candidatus Hadarchaeota archaeon]